MTQQTMKLADALGHEVADKRLDILRRIGEKGSISEAARGAGVSYKAAWQALDTLSNLAGTALIEKTVGGSGGGGARLTDAGRQLLQAAEMLHSARSQVLTDMAERHGQTLSPEPKWGALQLRTSMRNQLPCVVEGLKKQGQVVQVQMTLADGTAVHSRITKESVELLGLHPGQDVLALCKATAVKVTPSVQATPKTNAMMGRVTRASRSAAVAEVSLTLGSGLQLVGFTDPGNILKVGDLAMAHMEESSVVIALAG
jgi:molybdate transport system regulatory protein